MVIPLSVKRVLTAVFKGSGYSKLLYRKQATLWHFGLNLSIKSSTDIEPFSSEGSSQRSYLKDKFYFIQGITFSFITSLTKMIKFCLQIFNLESSPHSSKPLHSCFFHFWENIKIILIWKHHQNLTHTTIKYFRDEEWRKKSRDEISNPMPISVAFILNKLNFTAQIFAPDCLHCRVINHCKTISSSLPSHNKATFWNKSFFLSKLTRLRCWIFYQNNYSSHSIFSGLHQKLITISTVTANAWP